MPVWLAPAVAAATSAAGGWLQNRSAAREARANRQFQERMSSTSAQRARADYEAAGFNPALAYERPASSPGGSVAQVEDVLEKGVSSALSVRAQRAQLELLGAQTYKTKAEGDQARAQANLMSGVGLEGVPMVSGEPTWREAQIAKRVAELRDLAHAGRLQPHDERLRALAVAMQKAALRGAQFRGGMFDDAQAVKNFIRNGVSSAGDAAQAFKAWLQAAGAWSRPGVGEQVARNAVPKPIRRKP